MSSVRRVYAEIRKEEKKRRASIYHAKDLEVGEDGSGNMALSRIRATKYTPA